MCGVGSHREAATPSKALFTIQAASSPSALHPCAPCTSSTTGHRSASMVPFAAVQYGAALLRALWTLTIELLCGGLPLGRARLLLRTKGIDRTLIHSPKGRDLKAFIDGSVLESKACGCGVYYRDSHYLNFSGGFAATSVTPTSNLAELAALYFALVRHPRGQHLSIFSDSAFALRVVQAASVDADTELGSTAVARKRSRRAGGSASATTCPTLNPCERSLAQCIWWLLRLRTAQTCFYKVAAHKGFAQNHCADSLAKHGAEHGPMNSIPLGGSWRALILLLMRYLLGQSKLDGGTMDVSSFVQTSDAETAAEAMARRRAMVPRPKPTGDSTELTRVLALDCEMVGIGAFGYESRLGSVSICNDQGNQVYFSYAKPARPVTDYRTKYSGLEHKHIVDAPPAVQVQKEVKELVAGHVIVGHSLEVGGRRLPNATPRACAPTPPSGHCWPSAPFLVLASSPVVTPRHKGQRVAL